MSTALETPARTVGQDPEPRRRWAAVAALARFEARELRLQLSFLGIVLLYIAWIVWQCTSGTDDYPALQDVDRDTQSVPMLVGLSVMLWVNRAVLRSHRHDTERHFGVLVVEPWRRTVGHALSVVPAALFVAVCVTVQFTWESLKPGAVGHGSPGELAVGPLTVLLFGELGVLLGRLVRSAFAAPVLLVFLLFTQVLGASVSGGGDWTTWLAPVVTETGSRPFPSDLLGRPAAWHALYLLGLALSVAVLAVLAAGGRSRTVQAILAGALALTLVGAVAQSGGTPAATLAARERDSLTPEKVQSCLEHGTSTYCAFPEWRGRTADWAAVVHRVQGLAGGAAGGERLTVRQRIDARGGLTDSPAFDPSAVPGRVTVGTAWGGNRVPEFAVAVASVLVAGNEKAGSAVCDARMVTIMWLALGAESDPMTLFRHVRLDDSVTGSAIVLTPTDPLAMTAEQTRIVRELLKMPRYAVTARVKAHWSQLTSPKTSTARVAELLGVPAGPVATDPDGDSCGG
ncbi:MULTISPECIES: ABC transporter permease [unclassified Streptomyces]|uniref:ABC transporter permease n=1 Tax=unclassified Streptomyces TaxID=2593676 RepID=UPI0011CD678D|nr:MULTISPECIES: ABC transporter permease [unclassified Streptomyces]TXS76848.1 ABC transporter permease [Streptomyces sp. me109]